MKFCYLICAFYVLLLAAKPCCADELPQPDRHVTLTQGDGNLDVETCLDCSPFVGCCAAAGFIVSASEIPLQIIVREREIIHSHYRQPALPEVTTLIWQPPKLG